MGKKDINDNAELSAFSDEELSLFLNKCYSGALNQHDLELQVREVVKEFRRGYNPNRDGSASRAFFKFLIRRVAYLELRIMQNTAFITDINDVIDRVVDRMNEWE